MHVLSARVAPEWVDFNGHLNDAEYARLFSRAVEALLGHLGLDEAGRERHGYTFYTLENHLCYRREAAEGQRLEVFAALLERDARRLRLFVEMRAADAAVLATSEQLLMGVNTATGRPARMPPAVADAVAGLAPTAPQAWPRLAGRRIRL